MALGLQKSLILYYRRLSVLAQAQQEDVLNAEEFYEFSIPGSQQFNPDNLPGFWEAPA